MTYPTLPINNGPAQRDLELGFIARHLGARVRFTVAVEGEFPIQVSFAIGTLEFNSQSGQDYKLGGQLEVGGLSLRVRNKLPAHNWVFVTYNTERRNGKMEFSNGE